MHSSLHICTASSLSTEPYLRPSDECAIKGLIDFQAHSVTVAMGYAPCLLSPSQAYVKSGPTICSASATGIFPFPSLETLRSCWGCVWTYVPILLLLCLEYVPILLVAEEAFSQFCSGQKPFSNLLPLHTFACFHGGWTPVLSVTKVSVLSAALKP